MQKSISFYSEVSEIVEWLKEIIEENKLEIVFIKYFPEFKVKTIKKIEEVLNKEIEFNNLLFRVDKFNLEYTKQIDFLKANPDTIIYSNSCVKDKILRESSIGIISENIEMLKIINAIIRKVKKNTKSGMWVTNFNMNTKAYYKNMRYSDLVNQMYINGVILKPVAGENQVYINEKDIAF